MTTDDNQVPGRARHLRMMGLTGALLLAGLAALLWLGADVTGTKECMANAYGLGVEGGGTSMTEAGCQVTVPTTTSGLVSGVLPTLSESLAGAALIAALACALPPAACLWLATRRPR
jgi:hypothetical protein